MKVRVQSGKVSIEHFGTNPMIADPLKVLSPTVFREHTAHVGVKVFKEIQFQWEFEKLFVCYRQIFMALRFKDKFGLFSTEIRFWLTL